MPEERKDHASGHHQDRKLFDVAHPGRTAPSHTSRPAIVNHGPMLADPMMRAVKEDADEQDNRGSEYGADNFSQMGHGKTVPAPEGLSEEVKASQPEPEPAPEATQEEEPAAPDAAPVLDEKAEAVVDSVAEQAADHKKENEAAAQAAAQAAKVADLVKKKTYFVPVNVAKRQRSAKLAMIAGGVLLLGIVGFIAMSL